jgi:hypothetical protein
MSLEILPIKKPTFDDTIKMHPDFYELPACAVHVAKSKSGKGVVEVNCLLNPNFDLLGKLEAVHIYSPTAKSGDITWRHVVEQTGETIYPEYTDKHLRSILDSQLQFSKKDRPKIGIIFDDIGAFGNITKNSLLFKLSTQYRHYGIYYLKYIVQQWKMVPPMVRANIDYLLVSRTTNEKEVSDIEEEVASKYDGAKQFRKLLLQATKKPYSFLYLRLNDQPSTAYENFTKKIYTAKALGQLEVDFGGFSDKPETINEEGPDKKKKKEDQK